MTKLVIFDLDDTLFYTGARVVVNGPGYKIYLAPSDWTEYQPKEGEEFDYSQFRCAEIFKETKVPIKIMCEAMNTMVDQVTKFGGKVAIVTARGPFTDCDAFIKACEEHLDMRHVDVVFTGTTQEGTAASRKAEAIDKYLATGLYEYAEMYDDNLNNLYGFVNLQNKYKDIVFHAYLVNEDGIADRINFGSI